jgi:hypothetical protein
LQPFPLSFSFPMHQYRSICSMSEAFSFRSGWKDKDKDKKLWQAPCMWSKEFILTALATEYTNKVN